MPSAPDLTEAPAKEPSTPGPATATAAPEAAGRRHQGVAWLYVVGGLIGLAAAFTLLVEKIALLKDPSYVPSCSISPILSCGSIMKTDQAEAFGFPNPILGIAGFAIVATIGMAILAGATFRRWFWLGLQAGTTFGVVFIHWLIFQSLYRIDALCPYCMVVWVVAIPLFWYTTLHNLRAGHLPAGPLTNVAAGARTYHSTVLTGWYLVIAALITQRFWDYWSTILT
jgi:uncharacterized membrane protein